VSYEQAGGGTASSLSDGQWMVRPEDHRVAAVESEEDALVLPGAFNAHLDCSERRGLDVDIQLLDGRDEDMTAIRFTAQDRGK